MLSDKVRGDPGRVGGYAAGPTPILLGVFGDSLTGPMTELSVRTPGRGQAGKGLRSDRRACEMVRNAQ